MHSSFGACQVVNSGQSSETLDAEPLDAAPQRGRGTDWAWLTFNQMTQNQMTPLHLAAWRGHEAVVGVLVTAGLNKEAKDKVRERGGC